MIRRLIRIILLTFCFLLLISASESPRFTYADGDPDEVVERGPDPDNPPEPPPGGEEPPEGLGDPDEIVETGDPLGPPMHQTQGIRGVGQGTAYWLVLEAMQASWLIMR